MAGAPGAITVFDGSLGACLEMPAQPNRHSGRQERQQLEQGGGRPSWITMSTRVGQTVTRGKEGGIEREGASPVEGCVSLWFTD